MQPIGLLPQQAANGRTAPQAFTQAWHNALALAGRAGDSIVELETADAHLVSIATMRAIMAPGMVITLV